MAVKKGSGKGYEDSKKPDTVEEPKEETTAEAQPETQTADAVSVETVIDGKIVKLTRIYIGPTIKKYQLLENQFITGTQKEIDDYTAAAREEFPTIKHLLVSIEDLAEKKQLIRTQGSMYRKFYGDIVSAISVNN